MPNILNRLFPPLACLLAGVPLASAHDSEAQLPFQRPHAHESLEGHAHLGWESRYFSEGRDNLDGDSLFIGSIEAGWHHFSGGIWYGRSPDQRYDELQLALAVTESFGDFEWYGSYTHLRFPFDDSHDNELGTGISWSGLPFGVDLAADLYHSFDAGGYFAEISASREFEINDRLSLNLTCPFGINQGYVADGHDGANHVALRIGLEYVITRSVSATAQVTQSWALDRNAASPGDATLTDLFHGGIGLQWTF